MFIDNARDKSSLYFLSLDLEYTNPEQYFPTIIYA